MSHVHFRVDFIPSANPKILCRSTTNMNVWLCSSVYNTLYIYMWLCMCVKRAVTAFFGNVNRSYEWTAQNVNVYICRSSNSILISIFQNIYMRLNVRWTCCWLLYIQFYSHSFTCSVVSLIGFNDFISHFICSAVKLKNKSHILEFMMEFVARMLFSRFLFSQMEI